jgi:4-amino-4-deoxy-L-arabinose transferase-like glycosyltransferase
MSFFHFVARITARIEQWLARRKVERWLLWTLFLASAGLRLWFVLWEHPPGQHIDSDMWVYDLRAHRVMEGTFELEDTFQPLGYPALVALIYSISDNSRTLVGVVQALMGGATVVFAFQIARRVASSRLFALVAALAVAVHLPMIFYAGLLLTEVPFSFALMLAFWLMLRAVEQRTWKSGILAGAALGAAIVVRSNLLAIIPFLPLFVICALRGEKKKQMLILGAQLMLGALIPMGTAVTHNSIRSNRVVGLATNGGLNFYMNFAEIRTIRATHKNGLHHITPIPNLLRYEQDEVVPATLMNEKYHYQRGVQLIRERPARLLRAFDNFVEGAGAGKQDYWPGWRLHDRLLSRYSKWFFWFGVLPGSLHLLWIFVSGRFLRPQEAPRALIGYALLSVVITLYWFLGDPRMRVPFDPLVIVLALDGLRRLVKWLAARVMSVWRWWRRRRGAIAIPSTPAPASP